VFFSTVGANATSHVNGATKSQIEVVERIFLVIPMTLMVIFDGLAIAAWEPPDMGADEFSGLSDDQSAPAISYTILSNSCTWGVLLPANY
jgi:hypothetical protein